MPGRAPGIPRPQHRAAALRVNAPRPPSRSPAYRPRPPARPSADAGPSSSPQYDAHPPHAAAASSSKADPATAPLKRAPTPEHWSVHRAALKARFPLGWNPPQKISREAMLALRALHARDPELASIPMLASRFEISPEAVRRILKSHWAPGEGRKSELRAREQTDEQELLLLRAKRREDAVKARSVRYAVQAAGKAVVVLGGRVAEAQPDEGPSEDEIVAAAGAREATRGRRGKTKPGVQPRETAEDRILRARIRAAAEHAKVLADAAAANPPPDAPASHAPSTSGAITYSTSPSPSPSPSSSSSPKSHLQPGTFPLDLSSMPDLSDFPRPQRYHPSDPQDAQHPQPQPQPRAFPRLGIHVVRMPQRWWQAQREARQSQSQSQSQSPSQSQGQPQGGRSDPPHFIQAMDARARLPSQGRLHPHNPHQHQHPQQAPPTDRLPHGPEAARARMAARLSERERKTREKEDGRRDAERVLGSRMGRRAVLAGRV